MTTLTESVHFTVDGPGLNDLVNSLMREGKWEKAVSILYGGLQGISYELVYRILRGEAEIVGCGTELGVRLSENEEYKKQLMWHYGGMTMIGDHWFRPYAYVYNFGPEDIKVDKYRDTINWKHIRDKRQDNHFDRYNFRVMHYAKSRDLDWQSLVEIPLRDDAKLKSKGHVLFGLVPHPPPFLTFVKSAPRTPQECVDEYIAGGCTLKRTGHHELYGIANPRPKKPEVISMEDEPDKREQELEEAKFKAREEKEKQYLNDLRSEIIKQAGDDWYEFPYGDKVARVPKAPFYYWAMSRSRAHHLLPEWQPISPIGLKMQMDDPYHSDWLLGGGFELDAMVSTSGELSLGAYQAKGNLQTEYLKFQVDVLSGSGHTSYCKVVHPKTYEDMVAHDAIIILPNANPKWLEVASQIISGAIIVEQGGSLAHLVNVLREKDVKIVREPKARQKYHEDMTISVDCNTGSISII